MGRLIALLGLAPVLAAQFGPGGPPSGPFRDDLLDQLVGVWTLTGEVRGEPVKEATFAQWMLNHQFLMIHRKQIDGPHESFTYIGYDKVSERYVAHLLDTNGGRGSETLGYGIRMGDKIQFVFEYPSGPYHQTLSWDAKEKTWQFLLESKDRQAKWMPFATGTLHRAAGRGPQP
jgi:hypothetical protein